jgi:hypothetical protein
MNWLFFSLFWFWGAMTMSEATPAEWRKRIFACGFTLLGLPALISPLLTKADRAAAEQSNSVANANTAAIAGGTADANPPVAYSIRVTKLSSEKLKLKGLVATRDDHKALLGLVKASFPSADVSDRVKVTDAPKTEMKLGGISFALKALSYLQAGSARVDEQGVVLTGEAESRAVYNDVKALIDSGRPTGLLVKNEIVQPRDAFSWRAEVGEGKVHLTGAVPAPSDKNKLEAIVQKLFSGAEIVDDTYVSDGAPESWLDAAMHSLKVLRLLNFGSVQLADHSVRLDGHTFDEATLRVIDDLADRYPAGFALESQISAPPAHAGMFSFGFPYSATSSGRGPVEGLDVMDGDLGLSMGIANAP